MMKFVFLALASLFSLAGASASDLQQIDALIRSGQKVNVANPSTDGDVIVPVHSVGFSGSGNSRMENFEQSMRLTKTFADGTRQRLTMFVTTKMES